MGDPEFGIRERTMGVMGTDSKGDPKYFERGSFALSILKHVEANGGQDSGFLCVVKCSIIDEDKYAQ